LPEIRRAPSLAELRKIKADAKWYQDQFRSTKDVRDRAGEVQVEADDKLAVELDKVGKATGTRGQLRTAGPGRGKKGKTGGPELAPPVSEVPSLAEMDVDRKWAALAHRVHDIPRKVRDSYIADLKATDRPVTSRTVLAKDRAARKELAKQRIIKAAFSEDGPFGTVVIDPPWEVEKIDRDVRPNQAEFAYKTMSEEEIVAFWQKEMAPRLETDTHVLMWATEKFLPTAWRIIEAVGLRYVLTFVWHKAGGFQPIGLPQYNCEFVVYEPVGCYPGSATPIAAGAAFCP
jgi:hypothetical protein